MSDIVVKKLILAIVSVLLLLSIGGGFLLFAGPPTAACLGCAPVGPRRRVLWSLLPAAAMGMAAWAAVYMAVGESKP